MKTKRSHLFININLLNDINFQHQSFFLFNFLFSSPSEAEYTAGTVYTVNNQSFTLSHTLRTIPEKLFSPMQAFSVLNDEGVVMGDLHLLSIGIVYYQPQLQPTINPAGLDLKLTLLIQKMREHYSQTSAPDPLSSELEFLEGRIKAISPSQLLHYYLFTFFYNVRLSATMKWKTINFSLETNKEIPYFLHCFLASTKDIHLYLFDKGYIFQNYIIKFDAPMVRRQRSKSPFTCFDILDKNAVGSGHTSAVYSVVSLYVEGGNKSALKHPYVYKMSSRFALDDEFEATKEIEHLKRARNYHPEFFSLPYFGECFNEYFVKKINTKKGEDFIYELLNFSAKLFFALAEQFKGKVHGDIKIDNICVDEAEKLWIIDYRRVNNFTYHYASPEVLLRSSNITPASDVYSAARSLVEVWGDPHEIWDYSQDRNDLIVTDVVFKKSSCLLAPFFEAIEKDYDDVEFPRSFLRAYNAIIRQCHHREPERRPTALAAANAFEEVFQGYAAYLLARKEEAQINQQKPMRRFRSQTL